MAVPDRKGIHGDRSISQEATPGAIISAIKVPEPAMKKLFALY